MSEENDLDSESELIESPFYSKFLDDWITNELDKQGTVVYPKGTLLIAEGDKSDGLFIIIKGKVKIFMSDENGKEIILAIREDHEYIGEIATLDGDTRTASVITLEETEVIQISRNQFREFLAERPDLAFEMIQVLTGRIRNFAASIRNLAFKNVYGRIVAVLNENSEPLEDGGRLVTSKFTQQDIADMVGSSREMVSRVFSELTKGEYISIENKVIRILKKLPKGW